MDARSGIRSHKMTAHRFPMAEMFPPEDDLARWVMVLSMAWQDLVASNEKLITALDADHLVSVQDAKRVVAHAWDLSEFLEESREREAVKRFVDSLSEEGRDDYAAIFRLIEHQPAEPGRRPFKGYLAGARNYASHYAELDRKELARAIRAVANAEGVLRYGTTFGSVRAEYAEVISVELFFPGASAIGPNPELEQFIEDLRELVLALMRFVQRVLDAYFRRRLGFG